MAFIAGAIALGGAALSARNQRRAADRASRRGAAQARFLGSTFTGPGGGDITIAQSRDIFQDPSQFSQLSDLFFNESRNQLQAGRQPVLNEGIFAGQGDRAALQSAFSRATEAAGTQAPAFFAPGGGAAFQQQFGNIGALANQAQGQAFQAGQINPLALATQGTNPFAGAGRAAFPELQGQQFLAQAGQAAGALQGFDPNAFAQTQFDRLQSLAGPGEQTAANQAANRLFSQGRLGAADTRAGGVFGALSEAQQQARTGRALQAIGLAGQEQNRLLGQASTFANLGAQNIGLGEQLRAGQFGRNLAGGSQAFQQTLAGQGQLFNQALQGQQALQSADLFGFNRLNLLNQQQQAGTQAQFDLASQLFGQGRDVLTQERANQQQALQNALGFGGGAGSVLAPDFQRLQSALSLALGDQASRAGVASSIASATGQAGAANANAIGNIFGSLAGAFANRGG